MITNIKKSVLGISASVLCLSGLVSAPAIAFEPFIGEIKMVGFNFAPRGYAKCDGQLLPIAQNTALFSLLGVTFGGDGRTTFALPDLRGRVAIHPGRGPGLSVYSAGQRGGVENVTLTVQQMPSHNHGATTSYAALTVNLNAYGDNGGSSAPANNVLAEKRRTNIYSDQAPDVVMSSDSITLTGEIQTTVLNAGGGQSIENRMPFLGINHVIALQGIFPSRS